jgi:hypothetical protein
LSYNASSATLDLQYSVGQIRVQGGALAVQRQWLSGVRSEDRLSNV